MLLELQITNYSQAHQATQVPNYLFSITNY